MRDVVPDPRRPERELLLDRAQLKPQKVVASLKDERKGR